MIELLSVLAILVTGTAAVVLVRAAWHNRGIWSLLVAAVGSTSSFVISLIAGGLYIAASAIGPLPLHIAQPLWVTILLICVVPAAVFLWAYLAGKFR